MIQFQSAGSGININLIFIVLSHFIFYIAIISYVYYITYTYVCKYILMSQKNIVIYQSFFDSIQQFLSYTYPNPHAAAQ